MLNNPMPETRTNAPSRITLRFSVWQFVRVMVQLERVGGRSAAYRAWWKDWKKLDRRLERLGKADPAGFSRLMMDEEVVIEPAGVDEARDVVRALDAVIRQMNSEIKQAEAEQNILDSIGAEREELIALRDDIKRQLPGGKRAPRRRTSKGA